MQRLSAIIIERSYLRATSTTSLSRAFFARSARQTGMVAPAMAGKESAQLAPTAGGVGEERVQRKDLLKS